MEAIKNNNVPEVEQILQSNTYDVEGEDDNGLTPLIQSILQHNLKSVEAQKLDETVTNFNNLEIAKLLLKSNADVNNLGKSGGTPLTLAAQFGSSEVVKLLLTNKADINEKKFELILKTRVNEEISQNLQELLETTVITSLPYVSTIRYRCCYRH